MQWRKQGFEEYKDLSLISDHAQRLELSARNLDIRAGTRTAVSANQFKRFTWRGSWFRDCDPRLAACALQLAVAKK